MLIKAPSVRRSLKLYKGNYIMDTGRFYFINDKFFKKHDPDRTLMQNKENINGILVGRPCFMTFPDQSEKGIFWCIPISSKVKKYKEIVAHKIQKQNARRSGTKECDTIRFAFVMGDERAFLIQNMFPITDTYITNKYLNKSNNNQEVRIAPTDERDIIARAEKVLRLHRSGIKLVFGDIDKIYNALLAELTVTTV